MNDPETVEVRYLRGEIDFEDALREVTGIDIGRDDLARILHGMYARPPTGPGLSEPDARALAAMGFSADPVVAAVMRVDRDIRMVRLVAASLSIDDAAARLGVTPSRIRQRISDGTLWAFDSDSGWLLPPALFTEHGEVPHLETVVPHLSKDLHPLTVHGLLTQPQSSLILAGHPVSVVEWLTGSAATATNIELAIDVIEAARWESG